MTYLRREAYRRLQRIFGFAPWHVDPYDYRPYAKWMVEKLSRMLEDGRCGDGEIVEIGCGLGDIISNNLTDFLTDNDVALFVVDRVPAPPYDYSHDYDDMLAPLQYHRIYTSRGFDAMGARRHVWLYAKGDCR